MIKIEFTEEEQQKVDRVVEKYGNKPRFTVGYVEGLGYCVIDEYRKMMIPFHDSEEAAVRSAIEWNLKTAEEVENDQADYEHRGHFVDNSAIKERE